MATAEQFIERLGIQFLNHAEDELRKGDLLQACETSRHGERVSHYVNSLARQPDIGLWGRTEQADSKMPTN